MGSEPFRQATKAERKQDRSENTIAVIPQLYIRFVHLASEQSCRFARAPKVRIEGAATLHSCLRRGASRSASAGRPSVRGAAAPDRLISQSHNKVIEQRPHRSDFFNGTAHHRAKQNTKTMGPDASASGLRFRRQLKVRRPQGTRITAAMSRGMKSWWSSMNMEAMRNSMATMPMTGRTQPMSITPSVPAGG